MKWFWKIKASGKSNGEEKHELEDEIEVMNLQLEEAKAIIDRVRAEVRLKRLDKRHD